jgi:hypothetical protein
LRNTGKDDDPASAEGLSQYQSGYSFTCSSSDYQEYWNCCEQGLHIPIVYNCGGYDSVKTLRLLDGIVDIYMPDAKYGSDDVALTHRIMLQQ